MKHYSFLSQCLESQGSAACQFQAGSPASWEDAGRGFGHIISMTSGSQLLLGMAMPQLHTSCLSRWRANLLA